MAPSDIYNKDREDINKEKPFNAFVKEALLPAINIGVSNATRDPRLTFQALSQISERAEEKKKKVHFFNVVKRLKDSYDNDSFEDIKDIEIDPLKFDTSQLQFIEALKNNYQNKAVKKEIAKNFISLAKDDEDKKILADLFGRSIANDLDLTDIIKAAEALTGDEDEKEFIRNIPDNLIFIRAQGQEIPGREDLNKIPKEEWNKILDKKKKYRGDTSTSTSIRINPDKSIDFLSGPSADVKEASGQFLDKVGQRQSNERIRSGFSAVRELDNLIGLINPTTAGITGRLNLKLKDAIASANEFGAVLSAGREAQKYLDTTNADPSWKAFMSNLEDASTVDVLLKLAVFATAATEGQTGRSMSDNDRKLFEQMVGVSALSADRTKNNLITLRNRAVRALETESMLRPDIDVDLDILKKESFGNQEKADIMGNIIEKKEVKRDKKIFEYEPEEARKIIETTTLEDFTKFYQGLNEAIQKNSRLRERLREEKHLKILDMIDARALKEGLIDGVEDDIDLGVNE